MRRDEIRHGAERTQREIPDRYMYGKDTKIQGYRYVEYMEDTRTAGIAPSRLPPRRPVSRGGCLRVILLLARRGVGRVGRAVSRHGYHASVAAAYPMRASDRLPCCPFISPPLVRSRMVSPLARSRHARRFISPRPSTRETGSRTGRGLARCCEISDVRRIEKSGRVFRFPVPLLARLFFSVGGLLVRSARFYNRPGRSHGSRFRPCHSCRI